METFGKSGSYMLGFKQKTLPLVESGQIFAATPRSFKVVEPTRMLCASSRATDKGPLTLHYM